MSENAQERLKSYAKDIFSNKTRLIRILLVLLIFALALVMRIHESSKADITVEGYGEGDSPGEICVDIGGAVVSPGVYNVENGTRLYEVIDMAGGLISNADTDAINRAEFVEDGEKIMIPFILSDTGTDGDGSRGTDSDEGQDDQDSGTADTASSAAPAAQGSGLVNINYASKEELMTLSGIGEAKAEKIIEYRSKTRFRKKEDIKSVNGIGDAVYNKIKDSITV